MPVFFTGAGWSLYILATVWIVLILLRLAGRWLLPAREPQPGMGYWAGRVVEVPVDVVRYAVPTLYRGVDFAPWLTLLLLVLFKQLVFRAMIYWGILNR